MAFEWLTDNSRKFLKGGYLSEGETPEQRIQVIADRAEKILGIEGFAKKLYDYAGRGWISFSSPVWSNFGKERGMPVSCFNSHVDDSIGDILFAQSEVGIMSKLGGGASGYFGDVRPRGSEISDSGKTSGAVHFMELFEKMTDVVSQSNVRRGRFAPYLPIDHGDIEEFLEIGTEGHPIQNLTTGVTVRRKWLEEMEAGDKEKRRIWAKLLKSRSEVGFPYIFYTDNANDQAPDVYKDKGYWINASNLCSEIFLASSSLESFVCVLSSVNLLHYDEWKNTDLIEVMTMFLDAVNEEFLLKLEAYRDSDIREDNLTFTFMERAYNFAKNHRALGLGVLGYHSLLQSKMLPFGSKEAAKLNVEIFKKMQKESHAASKKLAGMFGEPPVLEGYGRRNTHTMAVAPTTSSAFILGQVSQSIEPLMSNYYIKDLAKLKVPVKNVFLKKLLAEKGYDTTEIWERIAEHDGSSLFLVDEGILTPEEAEVFLTFREIDPYDILYPAAARQPFIDQGQSLNLSIDSSYGVKDINKITLDAGKLGIKSLYYQHSVNAAQEFARGKLGECKACEA